jgi:pyroglutamyl-peptidase
MAGEGALPLPRVLVTGFSVFPGAPVNPTEALVHGMTRDPPTDGLAGFRTEILSVEYAGLTDRLSAIGREFRPDIVIQFGLARRAIGFRLEKIARNSLKHARPDNQGRLPASERICDGPASWPSTLPLEALRDVLEDAGLPVEWSDDAGGYLCNMAFALARSGTCEGLQAGMTGFIHVPPLPEDALDGETPMSAADLERGARLIIERCASIWSERARSDRSSTR